MMRMPAAWHGRTASATSGRGGSKSATSPSRQRSRSASSRRSGALGAVGQPAPGDGEHAQPLRRVALEHGEHLARGRASVSGTWSSGPPIMRRAREHLLRRALRVHREAPVRRARRPSTSAAASGRSGRASGAGARAGSTSTSTPSARAASSSPTSVASPRDFPVRSGASSAVLHAAIARPRRPSTGSAATAAATSTSPSRSSSPSGVQTRPRASGSRSACRSCRCR